MSRPFTEAELELSFKAVKWERKIQRVNVSHPWKPTKYRCQALHALPATAAMTREWRCRFLVAKHLGMFFLCFHGHHGWHTRDSPSWQPVGADKIYASFNSPCFLFLFFWNIPSSPHMRANGTTRWVARKANFWKTSQCRFLWTNDNSLNVCPGANLHFKK